jgi:hypothetical protein
MGTDILVDEKIREEICVEFYAKKAILALKHRTRLRCIVTTLTHNALLLLEDSEHYVVEG